ncbi:MAG: HIT family protein [Thermomicrobiales bacterium]
MSDVTDCVFCQIVEGMEPASIVHADDVAMAIMTIGPVNTGHVMVIPMRHAAQLADLDEEIGMHLFRIAQRTAAAIRQSGLHCEGINFFLADGEAAFQEVFHVHLHVFPRFKGDAFKIDADWSARPGREELDAVAARIRDAYAASWSDGR